MRLLLYVVLGPLASGHLPPWHGTAPVREIAHRYGTRGHGAADYPSRALTSFTGCPEAALDFYDDLELDNTKSFWSEHKQVYEAVAKVFRPYRDVRFAKDKSTVVATPM